MRFLADENFPGDAVIALEHEEYDIVWIRAAAPGIDDKTILAWAMQDSRILLTFDKDFGELARSAGLPATCGGILFRLSMPSSDGAGGALAKMIIDRSDWAGHFSVIAPGRVRMRPLEP